jgi:choline dehydrogenase-like flavoprotein
MNGKLTSPEKEKPDFKAIIVGGGITGLTLANSLERAPISYILLEARKDIAPAVGASIGILPNGCRILIIEAGKGTSNFLDFNSWLWHQDQEVDSVKYLQQGLLLQPPFRVLSFRKLTPDILAAVKIT